MKCEHGHTMVPTCEYHPHKDGRDYVKFKCYQCGNEIEVGYIEYDASRTSGQCPYCGHHFWGRTIMKCGHCGKELPRVPHQFWGKQAGPDDGFLFDGWGYGVPWSGHVYTPDEWREEQAERARQSAIRRQQEEHKRKERDQIVAARSEKGLCIDCGAQLGFIERTILGHVRCEKHRRRK